MHTDQHTATKAKPSACKDPWAQVRRAIFQRINVRTPSGSKTMTRLSAYLEHLTASSAQGDLSAGRELRYIMNVGPSSAVVSAPRPCWPWPNCEPQRHQNHRVAWSVPT